MTASPPSPPSEPTAPLKSRPGLARIVNALGYSVKGFIAAFRHEAAFRQELLLVAIALPLGLYLGENGVERALLTGSLLLVLIVELLNSAVEAIVDKTSPEFHDLAGRAKDLGSAAVMTSLILAGVVWGLVIPG
ncbi:MAG: diacylglycerol kinase [Zoogloeaceae bacterium]|jgi:diacylglycerol kinase (ATP)|nr:diacylglycerol kinase [Zoogloeaceae bacterium]